ncbi:MAG: NADH dehydrogenase FAD-containing subunit [Aquificae bacterium]|nr:NADH dehydrogenase FAD-containing subunit [Aquificota bacterium]
MVYKYLTNDIIKKIKECRKRFPLKEQCIIPTLHQILEKYRDIPFQALEELAHYLDVPLSDIEGIVSFYDMFRYPKKGAKNHIRICRNLPCHLANYQRILEDIKEITGADIGKPNKMWYIELVECIGSCGIAPAFLINNDLYDGSKIKSKEQLEEILKSYITEEADEHQRQDTKAT